MIEEHERKAQAKKPRALEPWTTKVAKAMQAATDAGHIFEVKVYPKATAEASPSPLEQWERDRARSS